MVNALPAEYKSDFLMNFRRFRFDNMKSLFFPIVCVLSAFSPGRLLRLLLRLARRPALRRKTQGQATRVARHTKTEQHLHQLSPR